MIWNTLTWDAEIPVGTAIELRVKNSDTLEGLVTAPQLGPFVEQPVDLQAGGVGKLRYLEVEATLISDGLDVTPVLWSFNVAHTCPIPQ